MAMNSFRIREHSSMDPRCTTVGLWLCSGSYAAGQASQVEYRRASVRREASVALLNDYQGVQYSLVFCSYLLPLHMCRVLHSSSQLSMGHQGLQSCNLGH